MLTAMTRQTQQLAQRHVVSEVNATLRCFGKRSRSCGVFLQYLQAVTSHTTGENTCAIPWQKQQQTKERMYRNQLRLLALSSARSAEANGMLLVLLRGCSVDDWGFSARGVCRLVIIEHLSTQFVAGPAFWKLDGPWLHHTSRHRRVVQVSLARGNSSQARST